MNREIVAELSLKKQITQTLDSLNKYQLQQLVEYLSFLKFSARLKMISSSNEKQIAALYAEFAEEDRKLAEEGMEEYSAELLKEDTK